MAQSQSDGKSEKARIVGACYGSTEKIVGKIWHAGGQKPYSKGNRMKFEENL
jgi:hypothetical protein